MQDKSRKTQAGMRQNFTDQTVLEMPKIVCANLICLETSCQMGACGLDTLSDAVCKIGEEAQAAQLSYSSVEE